MARKPAKLSDQLRQAINTSGKTRYRLWQETGIAQAVLSKFMHGKGGLSTDGWDKLAKALRLKLVAREQQTAPKGR